MGFDHQAEGRYASIPAALRWEVCSALRKRYERQRKNVHFEWSRGAG